MFDNEEDFVSECRCYNQNGTLTVGVNLRSPNLLDDYGGLENRVRTLISDVAEPRHVPWVTDIVLPSSEALAGGMNPFVKNASVLSDGTRFLRWMNPCRWRTAWRPGSSRASPRATDGLLTTSFNMFLLWERPDQILGGTAAAAGS